MSEQRDFEVSHIEHRVPDPADVELSVPVGLPAEDFARLLETGRARLTLSLDDVMAVLRHVELTPNTIDTIRHRLAAEGIELDESVEVADPAEILQALPDASGRPVEIAPVVTHYQAIAWHRRRERDDRYSR